MADSMEPERSVESLEVGFEVTDIEFGVTVQHSLDFRITSDVLGHNRDTTFRQVLDAGSDVDRRAEIVQALVQGYCDAGALVQSGFDGERMFQPVRILENFLNLECGSQRGPWIAKGCHHSVADRLYDAAAVAVDCASKQAEVIHHQPERGGIPDFPIHSGRSAQIGEQDGEVSDSDPLPGAKGVDREEVPVPLQGGWILRP
tara:strand:- start:3320 stop:3925 length:606 start_codon:yes stop_codon:yes gene_type:complete